MHEEDVSDRYVRDTMKWKIVRILQWYAGVLSPRQQIMTSTTHYGRGHDFKSKERGILVYITPVQKLLLEREPSK